MIQDSTNLRSFHLASNHLWLKCRQVQLLWAVGNFFNDVCRQLNFSFQSFLSKNPGGRKSWHLFITVLMSIIIPFFFNRCFLCNRNHGVWLSIVYCIFLISVYNICLIIVEINYLYYNCNLIRRECTALNAMKFASRDFFLRHIVHTAIVFVLNILV